MNREGLKRTGSCLLLSFLTLFPTSSCFFFNCFIYISNIYFEALEETLVRLFVLLVLGLRCCAGFPLAAASGGYTSVAVCALLVAVASLLVERRL